MSFHIFQILEIESLHQDEFIINISSTNSIKNQSNQLPNNSYLQVTQMLQIFSFWILSEKFNIIKNKFEVYILAQYPCLLCSYYKKMIYSEKLKWIRKNDNFTYLLIRTYSNLQLITNPNPPDNRIPVCNACYKNLSRNYPPYLYPIPLEIENISLWKKKYLSPIFLHSSLGRTPNMNNFTTYRSFVDIQKIINH